jgi:hypothetical protein
MFLHRLERDFQTDGMWRVLREIHDKYGRKIHLHLRHMSELDAIHFWLDRRAKSILRDEAMIYVHDRFFLTHDLVCLGPSVREGITQGSWPTDRSQTGGGEVSFISSMCHSFHSILQVLRRKIFWIDGACKDTGPSCHCCERKEHIGTVYNMTGGFWRKRDPPLLDRGRSVQFGSSIRGGKSKVGMSGASLDQRGCTVVDEFPSRFVATGIKAKLWR